MARWHYPRSRRILMQVVMCLIFAGSVGLAGLVTRQRKTESVSQLGGMLYLRGVGVRLPAGWALEREGHGFVLFLAREPNVDDREGRTLIIRRQKVDPALTSDEYLEKSGLLAGTQPFNAVEGESEPAAEPILLAKMHGIMLAVERPVGFVPFGAVTLKPELIACSVRHSGVAITMQLLCPDGLHVDEDKQLLRDTAAAIDVKD